MTVEEQDSSAGVSKRSPIRPAETLGDYYYRSYSEKDAADLHAPVWNLKKGDTFADWHACQDWLQGILPPGSARLRNGLLLVGREGPKLKLLPFLKNVKIGRKFVKKIMRRKQISVLSLITSKLKNQDAEVERLKKEKADLEAALAEARSHRERSEQREVQALSTLAIRDKELEELTALVSDQERLKKDLELARSEHAESSRRLTETEEKLENSETARASAESELGPLKNDMTWLKDRGIACVVESVLNSKELDKTVADLVVAAWRDGYAQGYAECSHHVTSVLKVTWDNSKSAAFGVDTAAALASLKAEFNNLQLPVMELIMWRFSRMIR
ncbi:hypothetical protein HanIR_Chr09g0413591 [Helianthus annuus]|nr:hypothetical protein HanIR_Chr09g0413591 [Helianthus annuus]